MPVDNYHEPLISHVVVGSGVVVVASVAVVVADVAGKQKRRISDM